MPATGLTKFLYISKTMRILFLFILVLVFSFGVEKSKEITLELKYVTTEKSKDSYSITETWRVSKNALTYSYINNNHHKTIAPKNTAASLTQADLDTLANSIRKNKLLIHVPAEKYGEYKIPYTSLEVILTVNIGKEKGNIYLYELKNAMGGNVNYQHIEKLHAALRKHLTE
jgi:hypothetical protein